MSTIDRKAAIAAYKERKTVAGIYVVRCEATGETWVGRAFDLDKVSNRLWFTLRQGGHPCRELQAAWNAHGATSVTMSECERLDEDETTYVRDALLRERMAHWRKELNAGAL